MKSMKKLVLAAAILPVVLGSAGAYAFGGARSGGGMGGPGDYCGVGFGPRMMDELNLTNEQLGQLRDLRTTRRADRQAQRDSRRAERAPYREEHQQAMQELMLSDQFDEAKARQLAQEMSEQMAQQRAEQKVSRMQAQHEMLSVLTDEQKAQLKELQAQRLDQCAAGMGQRGRGGKGGGKGGNRW